MAINRRSPSLLVGLQIDWDRVERQIEAPEFETRRAFRPRDPRTGRLVDLEDPVLLENLKHRLESWLANWQTSDKS
ncbi:MAG: hypothetical protein ACYCS1_01255 [Gammaproteobacteria bacterium]